MKSIKILLAILLIFNVLCSCSIINKSDMSSKEMDKLQIFTEEFAPLNFMQAGKVTGQSTEVVREFLKRMGINKDITLLLWSDAYQKLMNEQNIALFSTCLNSERKDLFKWVGPISSAEYYFYTSKNYTLNIKSLEDAKKVAKIAVLKDYAIAGVLKKKGSKILLSSTQLRKYSQNY